MGRVDLPEDTAEALSFARGVWFALRLEATVWLVIGMIVLGVMALPSHF